MTVQLDEDLIHKIKRKPREDVLSDNECVALNLFWRRKVKVPILAKVFKVSKNTIYYRALTGTADSYPTSVYSNKAKDTNALIDKIGVEAAWKRYVTDEMVMHVNQEMEAELARRDAAQ
jgi:hypothetical protein